MSEMHRARGWLAMPTEPDAPMVRRIRVHLAFHFMRFLNALVPWVLRLRGAPVAWGDEDIARRRAAGDVVTPADVRRQREVSSVVRTIPGPESRERARKRRR